MMENKKTKSVVEVQDGNKGGQQNNFHKKDEEEDGENVSKVTIVSSDAHPTWIVMVVVLKRRIT